MQDKKHLLNLTIVVIVAIFFGVVFTVLLGVQQANNPAMRHMMTQQSQMLTLQKEISQQLKNVDDALKRTSALQAAGPLLNQQQALEQRIAALERKVEGLTAALKQRPAQGAPTRQGPPPEEYTKVHQIDLANSPVKGNKKAPVTIVEFVDFQCPFCSRFYPVVDEVLKAYPKDVNYVIKNFPLTFHNQAKPAAKAALAAGEQGKYWEMVDAILKNSTSLSEENFEKWAKDIGLNVKTFLKDYKEKDKEWEKLISADLQLGQKVEVRGTPTFYINGRKTAARDLAAFKKEIDGILNNEKR